MGLVAGADSRQCVLVREELVRLLRTEPRGAGLTVFAVCLGVYGLVAWDLQALAASGAVLAFIAVIVAIVYRRDR